MQAIMAASDREVCRSHSYSRTGSQLDMEIYFGLFLSALLSATLLPGTSEVMLVSLSMQNYDALTLWVWVTLGNTIGSIVNWLLGRYLTRFQHKPWFPFKPDSMQKSQRWFKKYGVWSLLMAWAPIIGDGLTFIAGLMRVRFGLFFVLTATGKGMRYFVILGVMGRLIE